MTYTLIRNFKHISFVLLLVLVPAIIILNSCSESQASSPSSNYVSSASTIEAGRYLVTIGGCNDCHTAGYIQTAGKLPESEWLSGNPVGFKGPWGTTYPANLRLSVNKYSETDWVNMCRTREAMPPMPWPSINKMSDQDLKAIYQFIKSLGPKGNEAHLMVAPGIEPETPYIVFEPVHMERLQQAQ